MRSATSICASRMTCWGWEAAHIQWHSHGGPDQVANGLALCTFHHGAFDRGAIGLDKVSGGTGYRARRIARGSRNEPGRTLAPGLP